MKFLLLLHLGLLIAPLIGGTAPRSLLIRAERFKLAKADAHDLLLAGMSDSAMHEEVLKRVADKTATLDQLILMRGAEGESIKVSGLEELPFASEFTPPQIPGDLTFADTAGASALEAVKSFVPPPPAEPPSPPVDPANPPPPQIVPKLPLGKPVKVGVGLITNAAPNKLEFKPLGDTWEVEVGFLSDAQTMKLYWKTESRRWLGDSFFNNAYRPNFQTQRLTGSTNNPLGKPVFVGTCNKAVRSGVANGQQEDAVYLQFVTTVEPNPPEVKSAKKPWYGDPFADPPGNQPPPTIASKLSREEIEKKTLRFKLEVISLPKATAHELCLAKFTEPALYKRLQDMVVANAAKMETSLQLSTRSWVPKTRTEPTQPSTFFSDFSQYHIPESLTISDPKVMNLLRMHGGGTAEEAQAIDQEIITATPPEVAVRRELGARVELSPVLSGDGETIVTSIQVSMEKHLGERMMGRDQKPTFAKRALSTTVVIQSKVPALLGTLNSPYQTGVHGGNSTDTISLAFLTCVVE